VPKDGELGLAVIEGAFFNLAQNHGLEDGFGLLLPPCPEECSFGY
jgi:hypothetical protein